MGLLLHPPPAFGGTAEGGHDREGVHQELQKLSIA